MPLPRTPLHTPRLLLRPYEPAADAPAFFHLLDGNRAALTASFPDRVLAVRDVAGAEVQLRHFAHDWQAGRFYVWGLWEQPTGVYVGDICLMPQAKGQAEIGYYLAAVAQGRGYAREALVAVCRFGFELVKARTLLVRCFADNRAGQAVALGAGFAPDAPASRFAWFRSADAAAGIVRLVRNARP